MIEDTYRNQDFQHRTSTQPEGASADTKPVYHLKPPAPASSSPAPDPAEPKSDELFQKFYSTFESLFSRISAPLAFAGLPLNPDEPPVTSTPHASTAALSKTVASINRLTGSRIASPGRGLEASQRASAEPDYSSLFSRAALRAVSDEHGPSGIGAHESFYVVPTSGHTMKYTDVVSRRNHRSQQGDLEDDEFEGDEELFVDARETPGPPSPEVNRRWGQQRRGQGGAFGNKTMEELQLENEAMKTTLNQTSRRLLEFEMSAQSSSVALQRSIRQLSVKSGEASAGAVSRDVEEKMRALEDQMLAKVTEMARMENENEKLKSVVGRYRDRFETIKAGARARREEGKKGEDGRSSTN